MSGASENEDGGPKSSKASRQGLSDASRQNPRAPVNDDQEGSSQDVQESEDERGEEEEEDEEPKLKYARLTSKLASVYRNGDATSAFLVAGDKMFVGTHNGNLHIVSLPSFKSIKAYRAHTASITNISISPFPPPLSSGKSDALSRVAADSQATPSKASTKSASTTPRTPRTPQQPIVPNIPSNAIYIATSSLDGNVCISSLIDSKDVQLRNFGRPVQAVAMSPDYRNDRTYISGGLAGSLVLTVGGRSGTSSTSSTVGTAAAVTSGWLGTIGLGGNTGKDTVLHDGEGTINTIKWSLSGKYVVWINEHGIWIMRSNLHLTSEDSENAWKRFAHVDCPQGAQWEEMAAVWKGRAEWIDETSLESDEGDSARQAAITASPATTKLKQQAVKSGQKIEKLLVGWGDALWIINVHPGGVGTGRNAGEKSVGRAEIIKFLRMDSIISGLSLYTPTLLLVLAYTPQLAQTDREEDSPPAKGHKSKLSTASSGSQPSGGIRHRQNAVAPELRLIDINSSEEVDTDDLHVSRFERLSASDYHLAVLPPRKDAPRVPTPKGTMEVLSGMGSSMWNATLNATSILSSAQSVRSSGSRGSDGDSSNVAQSVSSSSRTRANNLSKSAHPHLTSLGMKIFIHSPYDCILATKRDLSDHFLWLLDQNDYQKAWEIIDSHPEVLADSPERLAEIGPGTPEKEAQSQDGDDFFKDDVSTTVDSASKLINSAVNKEKRRIGELWIQSLVSSADWIRAGDVCGKVLGTSSRWEHWVYAFAGANQFDAITAHIPTSQMKPPLPSTIYELLLGHYIAHDRTRLRDLLDKWPTELYNVGIVITALQNQLKYRDFREDSVEDGEKGRDWRIVMESLGKLYVAAGKPRDALKCYIKLQDADEAMTLIRDYHLVDALSDDIPGLIMLRVSKEQMRSASFEELEEATTEAIGLLVGEAHHGLVRPGVVVKQLQDRDMPLFLFFYQRSLWRGDGLTGDSLQTRDRLVVETKALVDLSPDLAVDLFATYDRPLLLDYLHSSTSYNLEKASLVCEKRDYIPELVYLYSKTGQTKRALFLIIDRLADVSQAIGFAKEQDDPDLWEDLLEYSMDKPRFIRGLLEEVGTAIDPITLVRRIPEGLEIDGLRDGLSRMIKEHDLQFSISEGVARVLRGEVATAQTTLRAGQQKAVKFDIDHKASDHIDVGVSDVPTVAAGVVQDAAPPSPHQKSHSRKPPKPGHCVGCGQPFYEDEKETLVGFACGHVFHLTHLLEYNDPDRPVTPPDVAVDEDGHFIQGRGVGAKVTHARLLRDKIRDGCPVCTK